MIVARRVVIGGRVQGVGFRWFTRDTAVREGVSGWVCNLPDGRVEALIEGELEAVARVERALRRGPPGARVQTFTVEAEPPQRLQGPFDIIEGTSGRATRNV
jgi:acylphosphatase